MSQGRKVPDSHAKLFRKEYEAGATLQELSGKYGHDRSTMSRMIVRVGGTIRSRSAHSAAQPIISGDLAKTVRQDYEDGADLRELAKKYGVHFSTIRLTVIRAGGTMRKGGGKGMRKRGGNGKPLDQEIVTALLKADPEVVASILAFGKLIKLKRALSKLAGRQITLEELGDIVELAYEEIGENLTPRRHYGNTRDYESHPQADGMDAGGDG